MPICQNCGRNIASNETTYRREIYSGHSRRVNYGRRISFGNSNHYSVKNVCDSCAESIDTSKKKSNSIFLIVIALIVLGILLFYATKHN